jgi:hypothetical protein
VTRKKISVLVLLTAACLPACADKTEDVVLDDAGGLCVHGANDDGTYAEGESVEFVVVLSSCLPCGVSDLTTSCDVEQDGATITVHATAEYTVDHSVEICTADCQIVSVNCSSEPLAAGTYTVVYGDDQADLDVPAAGEVVTLGDGCSF